MTTLSSIALSSVLFLPGVLVAETQETESQDASVTPAASAVVRDLVAEGTPSATFRFELVDAAGEAIAGRLTFVGEGGPKELLFPRTDAAPKELAVRYNVVYTRSGVGAITVPAGRYEVWASRGLEWSAVHTTLELTEGESSSWRAVLEHEVDTEGWVSGDFHLHTLTYSGHGDSNLQERLISLVGEGVEFAVATDHNHHTDYRPTQRELGLEDDFTTVTGNEVSVPIGHFNVFPLEPSRPIAPTDASDANELFALLRAEPNPFDVEPIIQLNHPRWGGIDYFGKTGLDPITGVPGSPAFSYDFDTLEVLNAGEGWGYYDADTTERHVGASAHWVLGDWYRLLNQGERPAAVGNSDSHTVHFEFAGFPRNFVPSSAAAPSQIDVGELAQALRDKRAFTTCGPFVEFEVGDASIGGVTQALEGQVLVQIRIRAASWIDCDRVIPIYNGHALEPIPVPDTREVERLWSVFALPVERDGWLALQVEGDDSMAPIVDGGARPILPLAVTNPIWIDADGDGKWTSPWDQARLAVESYDSSVALRREVFAPCSPPERALLIRAAHELERPFVNELVRAGLRDEAREVRLMAGRIAEEVADRSLVDALSAARKLPGTDLFAQLALLRASKACGADIREDLGTVIDAAANDQLARYSREIDQLVPGGFVKDWLLAGYFPSPTMETLTSTTFPPERLTQEPGQSEQWGGWRAGQANDSGYLDLLQLVPTPAEEPPTEIDPAAPAPDEASTEPLAEPEPAIEPTGPDDSIAYALTWLRSPDARNIRFSFGADDGSRLWLNGDLLYEDSTSHGASPNQHFGTLALNPGWNRVLIKVANGSGGFGLYLRVFDPEVTSSAQSVDR